MNPLLKPLKIFLCHSNEDKESVRVLYQDLRKDGFDPWLDEEKLIPGQDWDLEIKKAEREADVIIICVSKLSSKKEGYIQKEIKFALDIADEKPDGTIYIVPVRLEPCNMPVNLSRWHWVDLFSVNGYLKLRKALNTRLENLANLQSENLKSSNPIEPGKVFGANGAISKDNLSNSTEQLAQNFETIWGNSINISIYIGVSFIYLIVGFKIMSTLGLIEQSDFINKIDYGITMLVSIVFSQAASVFFLNEVYGISKLTGLRYRVSSINLHKSIAWFVVSLGFISLTCMSLIGINASVLSSFTLNEITQGVIQLIFNISSNITLILTMFIFSGETIHSLDRFFGKTS